MLSQAEISRYSRQINLNQMGVAGQEKLKSTSVLCIGAGGIGSPVLLYLAAAGIGKIGIVDDDEIEISNLQRQILYKTKDCGYKKTEIAKQNLSELNDHLEIIAYSKQLNPQNAFEIISNYQIVIDGSDNYVTRYLANDVCKIQKKILISASLHQFNGQLLTLNFSDDHSACYRCLYPNPPPNGLIQNCAEAGIIGSIAGVLGTLAATQAIKMVLKLDKENNNKLFVFDGLSLSLEKYNFSKNSTCLLCAKELSFAQLPRFTETQCVIENSCATRQINSEQLAGYDPAKILIIDVRSEAERVAGFIPNSIHIPLEQLASFEFNQEFEQFKNKEAIVLYCKSGARSNFALQLLQEKGINNAYNLAGGILEWARIPSSCPSTLRAHVPL